MKFDMCQSYRVRNNEDNVIFISFSRDNTEVNRIYVGATNRRLIDSSVYLHSTPAPNLEGLEVGPKFKIDCFRT